MLATMKKDSLEMEKLAKSTKDTAGMTGYFGPAKYKSKPWYKRLFK